MVAEAQARQAASEIHEVLMQAECRVQTAKERTKQFAVELVNLYQHALHDAAARQEAAVMAETSEQQRLEARERLNTCLSELMSFKVLDAERQKELKGVIRAWHWKCETGRRSLLHIRSASRITKHTICNATRCSEIRNACSRGLWIIMRPLQRPTLQ
jgi:hypothetical protein